jgi:cytochrome c2/cytochrome b561
MMKTAEDSLQRQVSIAGWLLALVYFGHSILTITLARTDRMLPLREELRGWHYLAGTVLFALVAWRLWLWLKDRPTRPPEGVPAPVHHWGRVLALITYGLVFAAPLLGIFYAWADGLKIHLGPFVSIPPLIEPNRAIWQFTGYFHSGLGFMVLLLNLAAALTLVYTCVRYGRGAQSVLPPGYGAQVLLALGATVYAFATFTSREPGPRAVAIYAAIVGVVALIGWWRWRARQSKSIAPVRPASGFWKPLGTVTALGLLTLGMFGPWLQFNVTPWPIGQTVAQTEPGVVWHTSTVTRVTVTPETPFERQVRADLFKWCVFCHTMKKGDAKFKVGPNLYGIFGQPAGAVPGFTYSDSLMRMKAEGLVWTDETIAAYIADPEAFMPGTSMLISSGPIPDPRVQDAIVNILKRETMAGAIDERAATP